MNAALYRDDRQKHAHSEDALHQQLMKNLNMHTTDKHQGVRRRRTYHSDKGDEDSRIDDAFIPENFFKHRTPVTQIINHRGDSDHDPVMVKIPLTCMKFMMPGPDPVPLPREPKLKTPNSPDLATIYRRVQLGNGARHSHA